MAASKAPLPPRNPVPCAATAELGFVPILWLDGFEGDGPRPTLLLLPATVAFFCLLKARVAPCRAAETAGLAFPGVGIGKAEVEDVADDAVPRPCVWLVRVGEGGGCMWKEIGVEVVDARRRGCCSQGRLAIVFGGSAAMQCNATQRKAGSGKWVNPRGRTQLYFGIMCSWLEIEEKGFHGNLEV